MKANRGKRRRLSLKRVSTVRVLVRVRVRVRVRVCVCVSQFCSSSCLPCKSPCAKTNCLKKGARNNAISFYLPFSARRSNVRIISLRANVERKIIPTFLGKSCLPSNSTTFNPYLTLNLLLTNQVDTLVNVY